MHRRIKVKQKKQRKRNSGSSNINVKKSSAWHCAELLSYSMKSSINWIMSDQVLLISLRVWTIWFFKGEFKPSATGIRAFIFSVWPIC